MRLLSVLLRAELNILTAAFGGRRSAFGQDAEARLRNSLLRQGLEAVFIDLFFSESIFLRCFSTASTCKSAGCCDPYCAAKVKSAALFSFAPTVIFCVCSPSASCTAAIMYSPGGSPLISKLPFTSLTAKNGLAATFT